MWSGFERIKNWIKNSSLTLNFCGDSFPPKKHLPWCLYAWSSILCNNKKEFIKLNNFWFQWRVHFFFTFVWIRNFVQLCTSIVPIIFVNKHIYILLRNRSVLGNKTWGSVLKLLVLFQKTLILECYILIPLP